MENIKNNILFIVRGLPGSGKSTFANKIKDILSNTVHLETDQYFMKDGKYAFDRLKLGENHQKCFEDTKKNLIDGKCVIVSNTFTTFKELKPYIDLAFDLNIWYYVIDMGYAFNNVHDVPEQTYKNMQKRWKPFSFDYFNQKNYNQARNLLHFCRVFSTVSENVTLYDIKACCKSIEMK